VRRALRLAVVVAVTLVACAAGALPGTVEDAVAADECRGLQVCLPVEGPWVAIGAPEGPEPPATEYVLQCPLRNYVVAGIDARVSDRAVDVSFRGETGSPVGPGTTTGRLVVFTGVYAGRGTAPTSFRPFIGCVPLSGGGGQSQTSVGASGERRLAAFRPARPVERAFTNVRLRGGAQQVAVARCPRGGRVLRGTHAVAFRTAREPSAALVRGVSVTRVVRADRVVATARLERPVPAGIRVEVQVQAVCTRGAG
jgi:hypothetical protein